MKKVLIASAVSAAFAAPATALAQAVPTLDRVLNASGISVNGYIDTAYSYANKNLEGAAVSTRVFDSQNNSFALHQFGLSIAKQPGRGFGGLVNLTVGSDAQVIHSFPEPAGGGSMFDVTQAYMQYASGPLTVMAGKFVTLPLNPVKPLTITVSDYRGEETATSPGTPGGGPQGTRNSFDVVANYIISNPLSVGVELLDVSQENTAVGTAKYTGLAGYVTYMIKPQWRLALRAETFNDKNGFHFNTAPFAAATAKGVKYTEATATLSYLPSSNVELRGEVRTDRADTAVFDGASKSMMSFALQGLYKF